MQKNLAAKTQPQSGRWEAIIFVEKNILCDLVCALLAHSLIDFAHLSMKKNGSYLSLDVLWFYFQMIGQKISPVNVQNGEIK